MMQTPRSGLAAKSVSESQLLHSLHCWYKTSAKLCRSTVVTIIIPKMKLQSVYASACMPWTLSELLPCTLSNHPCTPKLCYLIYKEHLAAPAEEPILDKSCTHASQKPTIPFPSCHFLVIGDCCNPSVWGLKQSNMESKPERFLTGG